MNLFFRIKFHSRFGVLAFLDGSGRATLVNSGIGQLNGLAVDDGFMSDDGIVRLYWTDGQLQRIESVFLDGSNRQIVISKGLTLPFSIAVLDQYIYWTDSYNNVIERANRWTGADYQLLVDNLEHLQEIKIMSDYKQNSLNVSVEYGVELNPCSMHNGACSHLCLFRPHGYICACPALIDSTLCSTGKQSEEEILWILIFSSLVPGEINPAKKNETLDEILLSLGPNIFATNNTSQTQVPVTEVSLEADTLNDTLSKEFNVRCQDNQNTTKCESSHFVFDGKIIFNLIK